MTRPPNRLLKPAPPAAAAAPKLLAGGNPQIGKGDGNAPVQAYIDAVPGWKKAVVQQVDQLITQAVPGVQKAVRWNSPMYGLPGQGWFASLHVFTKYVKVTFFKGSALQPNPPGGSAKEARWVDIGESGFEDEAQLTQWIQQAAAVPGWGKG